VPGDEGQRSRAGDMRPAG